MNVYQIKWIDAESKTTWQSLEDIDKALKEAEEPIVNVGYIIKKTEKFIVLCSGIRGGKLPKDRDDNAIFDYTFIPKKWIQSIRILSK